MIRGGSSQCQSMCVGVWVGGGGGGKVDLKFSVTYSHESHCVGIQSGLFYRN